MIREDAKLHEYLFEKEKLESKSTRDGFGTGVVEAGEADSRVVVLCADLAESTRSHWFRKKFPDRYIEMGVAEQNLATVGSGLALYGKIPFITSYAAFSPGRNNEQIRTTITLNNVPVKICGMHAGVSVGPDGATHQQLEDIALMRVQPNMTVVVPCDALEAHKATLAAAKTDRPIYMRFARSNSPLFTTADTPFEIGKATVMWDSELSGNKPVVAIIACGSLLYNALVAAKALSEEGVHALVINNHTVKPMDEKTILDVAKRVGAVVTVEEHQIAGGMGSAVSELLSRTHPVPVEFIGVHDAFGQSGEPDELIAYYKMDSSSIKEAVKRVMGRA